MIVAKTGALIAAAAAGVSLACVAPSSAAQQGRKPAPAVSTEPAATTASYGDWILRCQLAGAPGKQARVCEVDQSMQVQGQNAPIAQIAMTRRASGDALQVVVVLPTNVSFPSDVRIARSDKDAPGEAVVWRRCIPGGCVAESPVKDAALEQWRGSTGQGRIAFVDAAGRRIAIPLSFKGLAQALDALDKEREKAP